jgi:hypothetical protein
MKEAGDVELHAAHLFICFFAETATLSYNNSFMTPFLTREQEL